MKPRQSGTSIYITLGAIIVSSVLLIIFVHSAWQYQHIKSKTIEEMERSAHSSIVILEQNVATFIASYEVHEYEKLIETEMENRDILAIVIKDYRMGEIVGNKNYSSGKINVDGNIQDYNPQNTTHKQLIDTSLYSMTHPIVSPSGEELGAISVYKSSTPLENKLNEIVLSNLFDAATISIALIVTLFFGIRNFILKPLSNIERIIRHSDQDGVPIHEVPNQGAREIVSLSTAMNRMLDTIKKSRIRLSEQHQQLKAREEELQTLSMAIEQSPVSIVICAADHSIQYVNPQFGIMTGLDTEKVIGSYYYQVYNAMEKNQLNELRDTLVKGRQWSNELTLRNSQNQKYWVRLTASPVFSKSNVISHYLFVMENITDQKKSEIILRNSEKMDALGQLTGGVAHDYNNLLGIIQGYSEQLIEELQSNAKLRKYAQNIQHASERGAKLTKKLLSFSKTQTTSASVINISELINEQHPLLEKTLSSNHRIVLELQDNLWPVKLDSSELEDAILNMSINAVHAMESAGTITIKTRNVHLNAFDAKKMALSNGDYVALTITDTGSGMDQATQNKIFEPFYTTKGESGTGLGLSQVYGFVERSGGKIKVYSEIGHGSSFSLYFPRTLETEHSNPVDAKLERQNYRGSETILVVDDETSMLELAQTILSQQGYNVLTAKNGKIALKLLAVTKVDLIISDIIMPVLDGYQLSDIVQKRYPDIRMLFVSGFADNRHKYQLKYSIFTNILQKPYTSTLLLQHVRSLLDKNKTTQDVADTRILIIDDEEDIQELYRLHLNRLGYSTVSASNAEEALSIYQHSFNNGQSIDAVITDLSLSGSVSGTELADKIREINPKVKIVVSSGASDCPEMLNFSDFGFSGAMEKAFDREHIKRVLDDVLS